jgi:hypothetical protein
MAYISSKISADLTVAKAGQKRVNSAGLLGDKAGGQGTVARGS